MRPLLLFALIAALTGACKKGKDTNPIDGRWIEQSLRKDTLDGDISTGSGSGKYHFSMQSGPWADAPAGSFYGKDHHVLYQYYFEGSNIKLLLPTTATMNFEKFEFTWGAGHRSFTVKKFYGRNALPETIVFERLR